MWAGCLPTKGYDLQRDGWKREIRGGVFFRIEKRSRFGLKNIIFGCESYAFTW